MVYKIQTLHFQDLVICCVWNMESTSSLCYMECNPTLSTEIDSQQLCTRLNCGQNATKIILENIFPDSLSDGEIIYTCKDCFKEVSLICFAITKIVRSITDELGFTPFAVSLNHFVEIFGVTEDLIQKFTFLKNEIDILRHKKFNLEIFKLLTFVYDVLSLNISFLKFAYNGT